MKLSLEAQLGEIIWQQEEEEEAPVPVQSDTLTPEDTSRLAEVGPKARKKKREKREADIKKAGGWRAARRNQGEVSNTANWSRARKNQGTVQWATPNVKESKLAEDAMAGLFDDGGAHGEYFPAALQESFSYKLEEAMQRSILAIASDVADIVGNKDPQTVMNIFDMVYSTLFPGQGAPAGDMPPGSGEGEEGHGEHASAKRIGFTIAEDTFPALETIVAEELAFMRETLMSDDASTANDLETYESIKPLEEQ